MSNTKTITFTTYNTRRNLPPTIGRKRGEANFLGAFERYLLSNVFQNGVSGKNFSLANYGIADLVWFMPTSASLFAFETKLENWRRAFQQAYRYSYYSDSSFVVLPPEKSTSAVRNLDLFHLHKIGLWLFDKKSNTINKIYTPPKLIAGEIGSRCGHRGFCPLRRRPCGLPLRDVAKGSTIFFFANAAPLFEKERDIGIDALIADFGNPFLFNCSGPWAGFSTGNHLIDFFEI